MSISIIGVSVFIIVVTAGFIYVRLRYGCFFEPSFSPTFPEELKPFMKEHMWRYHVNTVQDLLKRYEEAKIRETNLFSLERFLDEEKTLIKARKIFKRRSTRIR